MLPHTRGYSKYNTLVQSPLWPENSLSSDTSRMARDAVPDRSRAAPPDQGVLVTGA